MSNENVIELNEANFDQVLSQSDKPVLVDFWAEWCGPCRSIAPMIDEIANEKKGTVVVGKVNVDHAPALAGRFGVSSIPTLIVFKGGQPVQQMVGMQSKATIVGKLDAAL